MGQQRVDAVGCRHHTKQADDEGDVLVHRLALQLGTLPPLRLTQLLGQLRLCVQIVFGAGQHGDGVLGVLGQLRQFACRLFLLLFLEALLTGRTQQPDLRLGLGQQREDRVHVAFILEVALFLLAAVVFHHQIGHRGKDALARKAALAHGDPFEHPANAAVRQIIAAVDVKTVQIEGFLTDPAGADLLAGFLVRFQLRFVEMGEAKLCRSKQHSDPFFFDSLPSFSHVRSKNARGFLNKKPAAGSGSSRFAISVEKPVPNGNHAVFFAVFFLVAWRNRASIAMAKITPTG